MRVIRSARAVVEARVGHAQILTKGQAEDGGGLAGLGEAQLGRAARAHFAGGQVEGAVR